jgi:L-2-hydroxyglutarate oxidase LhgO
MQLFLLNSKFRAIAIKEPQKYLNSIFYKEAKSLVKNLSKEDIISSPKVGIRPQLINKKTNQLVMDFVMEQGKNDIHILNAISPAFTSSMAFAKKVVNFIH